MDLVQARSSATAFIDELAAKGLLAFISDPAGRKIHQVSRLESPGQELALSQSNQSRGNSPAESLDRGFPACGWVDPGADPYDALLARLRQEHVPFTVLWELTHTCNLDCVMCYNAPRPSPSSAPSNAWTCWRS